MFDMLGRAKWEAWKKRESLSKSEAKRLYVESLVKVVPPSPLPFLSPFSSAAAA
jgi:Acyl CoA binding protein